MNPLFNKTEKKTNRKQNFSWIFTHVTVATSTDIFIQRTMKPNSTSDLWHTTDYGFVKGLNDCSIPVHCSSNITHQSNGMLNLSVQSNQVSHFSLDLTGLHKKLWPVYYTIHKFIGKVTQSYKNSGASVKLHDDRTKIAVHRYIYTYLSRSGLVTEF